MTRRRSLALGVPSKCSTTSGPAGMRPRLAVSSLKDPPPAAGVREPLAFQLLRRRGRRGGRRRGCLRRRRLLTALLQQLSGAQGPDHRLAPPLLALVLAARLVRHRPGRRQPEVTPGEPRPRLLPA